MRTKTLLCAAALAAGVATSMAQSNVYSLNVVGYVNTAYLNQNFVLTCNPLNNTNNSLDSIMQNPPDNTTVFTWNDAQQKFDAEITGDLPTYSQSLGHWVPNATIPPGRGFFVVGGGANGFFTNTYVGEVKQGSITNFVLGNQNFDALASPVPISGFISNILSGYTAVDNDSLYTWSAADQKFTAEVTGNLPTYVQSTGQWVPEENIPVGAGFFLVRASTDVNWVRNFTVQ